MFSIHSVSNSMLTDGILKQKELEDWLTWRKVVCFSGYEDF